MFKKIKEKCFQFKKNPYFCQLFLELKFKGKIDGRTVRR